MQAERQTADNGEPAAAASDEHVRRLQSQLHSTAEQVVGASGSQTVEPGQTGQPAATTAQPGVPRYVVPPDTGDLTFGSSHWDGKPAEIHAMILKYAGPLTLFLCGLLGDTDTLDQATKRAVWTDAFKVDWQGDLALLPDVELSVENGLLLAHSRSMYDRLCKRFPRHTETEYAKDDAHNNNYDKSFYGVYFDSRRLMLIPMRHGWFDLIDFTHPIVLARMAIRFDCLDLLKHLDDEYKTLQHWMAKHDPASEYWQQAVEQAARYGHLDVVQYLFDKGVTCTTEAMDEAAGNGHLHVVKWIHANRTEGCTTNAMDYAAENDHLHVVKWLHANRTEGCTPDAMSCTARNGHLHVIKWLHENRTEVSTKGAMSSAALNGRLHVVQWLHEICGEECTFDVLKGAIFMGHDDVVQYMRSKGCHAPSKAGKKGRLKMLQYAVEYGYAVELEVLYHADIVAILLGSLPLDRARALLAETHRAYATLVTIERLESAIKKLQATSK